MKLAEALQRRADLQNKVEELRRRLMANASYQEGEAPLENLKDLFKELEESISQLESLIFRINDTNNQTQTSKGSLTKVLALRDALKLKRSVYASLGEAMNGIAPRFGRQEIKVYPSMDVKSLQKELADQSKALRELELLIQETNWLTELK